MKCETNEYFTVFSGEHKMHLSIGCTFVLEACFLSQEACQSGNSKIYFCDYSCISKISSLQLQAGTSDAVFFYFSLSGGSYTPGIIVIITSIMIIIIKTNNSEIHTINENNNNNNRDGVNEQSCNKCRKRHKWD